jgi:hypothetical protein
MLCCRALKTDDLVLQILAEISQTVPAEVAALVVSQATVAPALTKPQVLPLGDVIKLAAGQEVKKRTKPDSGGSSIMKPERGANVFFSLHLKYHEHYS